MPKAVQYIPFPILTWVSLWAIFKCNDVLHSELTPLQGVLQSGGLVVVLMVKQVQAGSLDSAVHTAEVGHIECKVPSFKRMDSGLRTWQVRSVFKSDSGAWPKMYTGADRILLLAVRDLSLRTRQQSLSQV